MSPAQLVETLNAIGIRNGVGISDIVENRLVGMKSRGVYETPAGAIIYYAHNELENLCLDRDTYHYKEGLAIKYAELVYDGKWFCALREALEAFVKQHHQRRRQIPVFPVQQGICDLRRRRSV